MRHDFPHEFDDVERWFKIFNKKSAIVCGSTLLVTVIISKFFEVFGLQLIPMIIGGLICLVSTALTMIPIPETQYMKGANLTLDIFFHRKWYRRNNRVLYVKGCVDDDAILLEEELKFKEDQAEIEKKKQDYLRRQEAQYAMAGKGKKLKSKKRRK